MLVKLNHVGCRSSSIRGQVRRSKGSRHDDSRLSLKAALSVIKAGLQLVHWTPDDDVIIYLEIKEKSVK